MKLRISMEKFDYAVHSVMFHKKLVSWTIVSEDHFRLYFRIHQGSLHQRLKIIFYSVNLTMKNISNMSSILLHSIQYVLFDLYLSLIFFLKDFNELSNGMNTMVGDHGVMLSGVSDNRIECHIYN